MIVKDIRESRRVSGKVRAVPKQCWFNARKVVLRIHDYAGATYVEGWVVFTGGPAKGLACEHGWVEKDGKVIDPTRPDDEAIYFSGLRFEGKDELEAFFATHKRARRQPCFYEFGWGGMKLPSFKECYERAWTTARNVMESMRQSA